MLHYQLRVAAGSASKRLGLQTLTMSYATRRIRHIIARHGLGRQGLFEGRSCCGAAGLPEALSGLLRTFVSQSIHTSMPGMLAFTPNPLTRAWTRFGSSTRYSLGTDWHVAHFGSSPRSCPHSIRHFGTWRKPTPRTFGVVTATTAARTTTGTCGLGSGTISVCWTACSRISSAV